MWKLDEWGTSGTCIDMWVCALHVKGHCMHWRHRACALCSSGVKSCLLMYTIDARIKDRSLCQAVCNVTLDSGSEQRKGKEVEVK